MGSAASGSNGRSKVGIDRRELLKAGVATAGLAFLPARYAEGAYVCKKSPTGEPATDISKCTEPVVPECDPGQGQPQGPKLLPWDNACELVLGRLWGAFADAAHTQEKDIKFYWDVFVVGRDLNRRRILTMLPVNLDIDGFFTGNSFKDEERHWKAVGREAAKAVMNYPEKLLTGTEFAAAWSDEFEVPLPGQTPEPARLVPLDLEATEVIGSHLWALYAIGIKGKEGFDVAVLDEGRRLSRGYLHKNVGECLVAVPWSSWPRYDRWNFQDVGCCAMGCGKKAKNKAGGNSKISKDNLAKAWCEMKTFAVRAQQELRKDPIKHAASGCS